MSSYRNQSYPSGGIRIDARTGESKRLGIRGTHRGTNGEIIGGYDADGQAFGTKADRGSQGSDGTMVQPTQAPSRAPATRTRSATPGLDKWHAMNPNADKNQPDRSPGWLARQVKDETKAALAGSEQLAGRQALYADMQKAGAGGLTPEMEARSKALGVTGSSFRRVAGGLPASTLAQAAKPLPVAPKPDGVSLPGFTQPSRTPQPMASSPTVTPAVPPTAAVQPPVKPAINTAVVPPVPTASLDPRKQGRIRGLMA